VSRGFPPKQASSQPALAPAPLQRHGRTNEPTNPTNQPPCSVPTDVYSPALVHAANGVVVLGVLGLALSTVLGLARACGAAGLSFLPEPWFPAAVCLDCQGGGVPLCIEVGATECSVALAALLGAALVVVGVAASAVLLWQLVLMGAQSVLGRASRMVENIGDAPDAPPAAAGGKRGWWLRQGLVRRGGGGGGGSCCGEDGSGSGSGNCIHRRAGGTI
jgi:hypothetical protein